MKRLFVALTIREEAAGMLSEVYRELCEYNDVLKVVRPENYHMTLKFFGNCEDDIADKIIDGFAKIIITAEGVPVFNLKGIGTFPNLKRASVIWCGINTEYDIERINSMFDEFGEGFGFKKENRSFKPHLTLARTKKNRPLSAGLAGYIKKNKDTLFGKSYFESVSLFSSKLTPAGPVYTEINKIPL